MVRIGTPNGMSKYGLGPPMVWIGTPNGMSRIGTRNGKDWDPQMACLNKDWDHVYK